MKKISVIIISIILILIVGYGIYDAKLSQQESKKYQRVLAVINAELKKGSSVEVVIDYLKKNEANLEIISISNIYWINKTPMFIVTCKVHSIIGFFGGFSGGMRVYIDKQNRMAESAFAGI